ncbi:MAG: thioredoxin family protein [Microcoleaceae cyanobacterium]
MNGTPINNYAPDFELPGIDDAVHHLARYLENYKAVAVIFLANRCPEVIQYLDRLKQLQQDYQPQGITLVGINPNDVIQSPEDNFEQMKDFANVHQLNFPYLRDVTQDVAQSFGATRTPEAFLLDGTGILRYRGQIDDAPASPKAVSQTYLRTALSQLLAGEAITPSQTRSEGKPILWR